MDFLKVAIKKTNKGTIIYPKFIVKKSKDLMVKGGRFYAIWDERIGFWSTDQDVAVDLIDDELRIFKEEYEKTHVDDYVIVEWMWDSESGSIDKFKKLVEKQMIDNYHPLDDNITFANSDSRKEDYITRKLDYALQKKDIPNWERLVGTLYSPDERRKIEWAIGSVVSGESKEIQKFIVFYGSPGAGKSTIMNVIQLLFKGYYTIFDAKALGNASNSFAMEPFNSNPLVAIQHDTDLSRITDNTRLNSIVSHEEMIINEKFKAPYVNRMRAMLFVGTNKPVKITDSKSGLIRRLITINPNGNKLPVREYNKVMKQIEFELGGIAYHCLEVFKEYRHFYDDYLPIDMMDITNDVYYFLKEKFDTYSEVPFVTLKEAWKAFKEFCDDSAVEHRMPKRIFKSEMNEYFEEFKEQKRYEGEIIKNAYWTFKIFKFKDSSEGKIEIDERSNVDKTWIVLETGIGSVFDKSFQGMPAQYSTSEGIPAHKWSNVKTTLSDIDTSKEHYVKVPVTHIIVDFDLKDSDGNKSLSKNIEAASKFPPTYCEISKSGQGLHLHYNFTGSDVEDLSRLLEPGIELKVYTGGSALRRRLTACNSLSVASIDSGLPRKQEVRKMIDKNMVMNEKGLRTFIKKNLRKEYHGATKPSIDFIFKGLEDAYDSGDSYDVSDLRQKVMIFAANSSNNAEYCLSVVNKMHFQSKDMDSRNTSNEMLREYNEEMNEKPITFFDVEVFPNLFVIVWKIQGKNHKCVTMVNPRPDEVEKLFSMKLVGFNNRRYDNHILYARSIGYSNEELYKLSQKIINGNSRDAMFGAAYNLSYTDIYDFASAGNKMGLKKWEVKLGIHHQELGLPWDEPVKEELWQTVADYCINDVVSTEAVFDELQGDYMARLILADITDSIPNDTTNGLTTKLVFKGEKPDKSEFVYANLSEMFPGYEFKDGVSTYRGEKVGEGGYVYAEPGIYYNVALVDVASMHPSSIENLNLFGDKYTKRFSELKKARVCIKHKDWNTLKGLLDGKLMKYVEKALNEKDGGKAMLKQLSNALKTAINSVYGLTSAKFDNPFRDSRNIDNIVAKRGALFMLDLKHAVQEKGFKVAHIKTDSIKIPDATPEIIEFVMEFGKKYGYEFEHEATYDRMCLVNNAVYICYHDDAWDATGTQFAVPYVFKTLFSGEEITFADLCETKQVKDAMYLDMNEGMGEDEHNYVFIGKTGSFCPIIQGAGGGLLMKYNGEKYLSVVGTKGYRWLESEMVSRLHKEDDIDMRYFENLAYEAVTEIDKYGDFDSFVKGYRPGSWEDVTMVEPF